ncbi:MAG: helix-turn-helix domain-containing protein [Oscillospiraceae bacterium]|nr:helix-turn-helix domain-containing protein [Oscillospiraceae bacterium]
MAELAYSVTEAAEALGVSRNAMYNLIHKEGFPTLKVGGRRLICRELLAEWVRAQAGGQKEAAQVLEHQGGRAEQGLTGTVSASSLHENRRHCQV